MSKRGWDVKGTGMHPTNIFKENPDKESPKDIYYMCSHFKLKKEKGDKYNCDYETHNCNFTRGASAYKCLMYQEETDNIKKEERINYGKRKENEKRKNKNSDNRNGKYEQSIDEPNILLPLIKREGLVKSKLVIADDTVNKLAKYTHKVLDLFDLDCDYDVNQERCRSCKRRTLKKQTLGDTSQK